MKKILAFETSCDDTAVAIIDECGSILGEAVFSQDLVHAPYLGVVPEVGSRAHIEQIIHVTNKVFKEASLTPDDIDVVAATFAPGLLGPLLVGAQFAKGFAVAKSIPLIAVHHIEGHILAGFSEQGFPKPPFLALIASGGHTALYSCDQNYQITLVSQTLDDAAGEAFDKVGRALGLGYPAGKIIDELAAKGDKTRFKFPVAMRKSEHFNFSFSGLKTKALQVLNANTPFDDQLLADFCASFREAVALALCERAVKAALVLGLPSVVLGGGVAANSRVREMLSELCAEHGLSLYVPQKKYCTDNAVMIARAALVQFKLGFTSQYAVDVCADLPVSRIHDLYQ
jgi:N6-L-threonylcarbamoyladenine synthase